MSKAESTFNHPGVSLPNFGLGQETNSSEEALSTDTAQESKQNRLAKALHVGKRAVEAAVVFFVVSPTNEVARVASTGAVLAATHDPYLATATWGGTTLAIETAAGLVAADLLDSKGGKKWTEKINDKLEKVGVKKDTKLNPVTKAGITYVAGTAVATMVEHREDPARTKAQNRKYGLKNAAALSAACTVQGFLVTEGIANPDPLTLGGAAIGIGSIIGIGKWASRRIHDSNDDDLESDEITNSDLTE